MMETLIGPHRDEMLESVVANSLDGLPVGDRKGFGRALTGVYGAHVRGEFPSNLRHVANVLGEPLGLSVESIIARTTFVPLYAPFIPAERLVRLKRAMLERKRGTPSYILGLHADPTRGARYMKYCPVCLRADLRKRQHSWWRRTYQARGVEVCPEHGVALVASQFLRNGSWKFDYPPAHLAEPRFVYPEPDPFSVGVAKDIAWLLAHDVPPLGAGALLAAYRELLERGGFIACGRLKRSDFLHQFLASHDRRQLMRLGLTYDVDSPYSWPAKLAMGAGHCHPPLRHICLFRFLQIDASGFVELAQAVSARRRGRRGPTDHELSQLRKLWSDRTCSLNEIGRRLGAHWQTVRGWATAARLPFPRFASAGQLKAFDELRQKMRRKLLEVGCRGGAALAASKWLGRNDSTWRQANMATRRSAPPRINWRRRDAALAGSVPGVARRIRAFRPFRQITIIGITSVLRCTTAATRHPERLPRFMAAVTKVTENQHAFAHRRIACVRRERPGLPPWRVREIAGISGPLMNDEDLLRSMRYTRRIKHDGN